MSTLAVKAKIGLLVLAITVNLVLAGTLSTREAYACSCAGTSSTDEALRVSDAVFSGEVVNIKREGEIPINEATGFGPGMFLDPVTFDVKESWKGVSKGTVTVRGQGPEASCGLDFDEGKTYLVFAYREDEGNGGSLATDFCGATTETSEEVALRMLGAPERSLPETGGPIPSPALASALAIVGAVTLSLRGALVVRRALWAAGRED